MLKNKQQGFTLIELVMVIVILGILSATALPKFVDLGTDARKANLTGLGGAIQGAIAIVKAGYLISESSPVTMSDGTTVTVGTTGALKGIPTGDATGIGNAIELSSDYALAYSGTVATFTLQSNCLVTYQGASGAVSYTDGGC